MAKETAARKKDWTPGTWSTDDYIRSWAMQRGMTSGECIVPLQSLHGYWEARILLDEKGQPVKRIYVADADEPASASSSQDRELVSQQN